MAEKFIKIYVDRLRQLAKECQLTRAELGELVLLSLFMNDSNTCRPGKQSCAEQIGMKSGGNARRIQRSLKRKGALNWDSSHDYASLRFTLPNAFIFGRGISQIATETRGGVATATPGGSITATPGGSITATPELDHSSRIERNKTHRNRSDSNEGALLVSRHLTQYESDKQQIPPKTGDFDLVYELTRKHVMQQTLRRIGIDAREAELMVEQFPIETIEIVLREATKRTITTNPAGYVRSMVERASGRPLVYTPSAHKNVPPGQQQLFSPSVRSHPLNENEQDRDSWIAERKKLERRRAAGGR